MSEIAGPVVQKLMTSIERELSELESRLRAARREGDGAREERKTLIRRILKLREELSARAKESH